MEIMIFPHHGIKINIMSHITSVNIPEPCHESWQAMTPATNGRHCQSCCKTVTDFTKMSNNEIIAYLSSNTNVCGRFSNGQMAQLNDQPQPVKATFTARIKSWAFLLAALGSFIFSRLSAQSKATLVKTYADTTQSPQSYMLGKVAAVQYKTITGTIVDKADGTPIPGAAVAVRGYNNFTSANSNGKFSLSVPSTVTEFYVSYPNYVSCKVTINADQKNYNIQLSEAQHWIGEVVIKKQK